MHIVRTTRSSYLDYETDIIFLLFFLGHLSHLVLLSMVFVRRRSFKILHFVSSSWKVHLHFCLKHLFDERNLYCKIHGSTTPRASQKGQICKKPNFQFFSLLPHMRGRSWMHGYIVYEAFYQTWEIHGSWVCSLLYKFIVKN